MLVVAAVGAALAVPSPPNIVFILSDDLGYGDISISPGVNRTGGEIPTPNIERMAANGMKFLRGYSGPVCAPSRCTLMTGRHLGHCHIRGNDGSYSPLTKQDTGVAKVLQGTYNTGIVGKWGLGDFGTSGYPLEQGYEYYVGQASQSGCHDWYPTTIQNNTQGSYPLNNKSALGAGCLKKPGTSGATSCTWANDLDSIEAVKFLRTYANQDKPFYLYLSTTTPHEGNLLGVNSHNPTPWPYNVADFIEADWPQNQKDFASAVWAQDKIVGAVLDEVETLGIAEKTIIFFSGDNGPDDHPFELFDDPGPFRGKKRSLHEGGVRQTIVVQWKGVIKPGTETSHLFAFWDFLPTAAELAGIPAEKWAASTDGVSIAPLLTGEGTQKEHDYLYWEFCYYGKANGLLPQQYPGGWGQALRYDEDGTEWKVIRVDREGTLLYNLTADETESTDLTAKFPQVVAKAIGWMESSHTENIFWPSTNSSTQKCCASCYNHAGCKAPCHQFTETSDTPTPPVDLDDLISGEYMVGPSTIRLTLNGSAVVVNGVGECTSRGVMDASTLSISLVLCDGREATGRVVVGTERTVMDTEYTYSKTAIRVEWDASTPWTEWRRAQSRWNIEY